MKICFFKNYFEKVYVLMGGGGGSRPIWKKFTFRFCYGFPYLNLPGGRVTIYVSWRTAGNGMVQSILEQRLFSRVRTLMEILECKACHGIKRFPCIHVSMRILSILAASAPLTISAYGCRGLSPNAPLQDSGSQELRTSP